MAQRDHLLAYPHAGDAFAQISAFASLHVGVTATILGLAWWHRLHRTTFALAVFLTGTMVATVYLGWHFAVDVPAGIAIAALAWWLAPWTVGVRRRPSRHGEARLHPRRRWHLHLRFIPTFLRSCHALRIRTIRPTTRPTPGPSH
jgi:uncharacterized membrane protein YfcA